MAPRNIGFGACLGLFMISLYSLLHIVMPKPPKAYDDPDIRSPIPRVVDCGGPANEEEYEGYRFRRMVERGGSSTCLGFRLGSRKGVIPYWTPKLGPQDLGDIFVCSPNDEEWEINKFLVDRSRGGSSHANDLMNRCLACRNPHPLIQTDSSGNILPDVRELKIQVHEGAQQAYEKYCNDLHKHDKD